MVVDRPAPRAIAHSRWPSKNRGPQTSHWQAAEEGQHSCRLGLGPRRSIRHRAHYSAPRPLRPGLHQHRLRALHGNSLRRGRRPQRPLGRQKARMRHPYLLREGIEFLHARGTCTMMERRRICQLWDRGNAAALVTLVRVEGSSYRRTGARLLIAADGQYAGSISGGCLEAEVIRKAQWLVRNGNAVVERYSTLFDDTAEIPFGLGCGGTVDPVSYTHLR